MLPKFRADLTSIREEQQGVVYYRLEDPVTKASYRLYEIEYLIAQKLDGARSPAQIIEAIKAEYNFDINEEDLGRFIEQLQSMGFVATSDAAAFGAEQEASTALPPAPVSTMPAADIAPMADPAPFGDPLEEAEPIEELDPLDADGETPTHDPAEAERLLSSALLHLRQGYAVHARDYVTSARRLAPDDAAITKLAALVAAQPDQLGPSQIESVWSQCQSLFPRLAAQVPAGDTQTAIAPQPTQVQRVQQMATAWYDKLGGKPMAGLMAAGLTIVLGGGLWFLASATHLFEGAVAVRAQRVVFTKMAQFYPGSAVGVRPAQEQWLAFGAAGDVAKNLVKAGDRVQAGAVLATLELPANLNKPLLGARAALAKAEAEHARAAQILQKVVAPSLLWQSERQGLEQKLNDPRGKALRGDQSQLKKAVAALGKKLAVAAKKEKAPRAMEAKAKKKLEAAQKIVTALEEKASGQRLTAPFAGDVTEVRAAVGRRIDAEVPAVHVRDASAAKLVFNVGDPHALKAGSEARISVQRGSPINGKVDSVQQVRGGIEVVVAVADPSGALTGMAPDAFRLVEAYVDTGFKVKPAAVLGPERASQVIVAQDGIAIRMGVEVLQTQGNDVLLFDPANKITETMHVVVERLDGQDLAALPDGASVQAEP